MEIEPNLKRDTTGRSELGLNVKTMALSQELAGITTRTTEQLVGMVKGQFDSNHYSFLLTMLFTLRPPSKWTSLLD